MKEIDIETAREGLSFITGYLFAVNAPQEVMSTINKVASMLEPTADLQAESSPSLEAVDDSAKEHAPAPQRKKRNFSPEARAAAAQRMRDMHARKKGSFGHGFKSEGSYDDAARAGESDDL